MPPTLAQTGGTCTFCGATLLPTAPVPATRPVPVATPDARPDPSPLAGALGALVALVLRAAPLLAGALAGAAARAGGTDGARLDMPWILGGASLAVLLWRAGGAVFTPALYAVLVGAPAALRPILRPIPTGHGGVFGPTSETALTWTLPGLVLAGVGVAIVGTIGGKALRARVSAARPRPLALGALALGAVAGWAGADTLAPRGTVDSAAVAPPARPPVPARPLTVSWSAGEGLIEGGGTIKASFFEGAYHVSIADVPEGGDWSVGEQSGRTGAGYTAIELAVRDRLGRRTWDELKQLDPEASLTLALTDGRTGTTRLPAVDARYGVTQLLQKVENGPVRFGDEAPDPAPRDALYWPYGSGKFIGSSRTLAEMDLVLLTRRPPDPSGTRPCPAERDGATPFTLRVFDTQATVYDRRTGEVVADKVFPGEEKCPTFRIFTDKTEVDSLIPSARIEDWARGLVVR